ALTQLKHGRFDDAWRSAQLQRGAFDRRLLSLRLLERCPAAMSARITALRRRVDANRDLRRGWHLPPTMSEVNWPGVLDELDANSELMRLEGEYYAPENLRTTSLQELQSSLPDNYAYIGWLNCRFADGFLDSPGRILDACWMYVIRSRGPI